MKVDVTLIIKLDENTTANITAYDVDPDDAEFVKELQKLYRKRQEAIGQYEKMEKIRTMTKVPFSV